MQYVLLSLKCTCLGRIFVSLVKEFTSLSFDRISLSFFPRKLLSFFEEMILQKKTFLYCFFKEHHFVACEEIFKFFYRILVLFEESMSLRIKIC